MSAMIPVLWLGLVASGPGGDGPSAASYPSIQEAVRANPGRMVYVPPGDHRISEPIRIDADGSGLFGPGRIVQADAARAIIVVEKGEGIQLRDLTLTRAEGAMETEMEGILAIGCRDLVVENVRVLDNRTRSSAISLRGCAASQVRGCLVRDYQRVSVDDRTANPEQGYAFKCVIGTGIMLKGSRGSLVQGNRVIERRIVPTPELAGRSELGRYVKKNATRGQLASEADWARGSTENWSQATAIFIGSPTTTDMTQVLGNFVENTGQGLDIHSDHIIISQNIVDDTLIGMKAMHGARNVLILGNQFRRSALWGIGLMPGSASTPARPASGDSKAAEANVDGGSIIANNIISDFGMGHYNWIWGEPGTHGHAIRFDLGQKPENPPLSDVIIQGNIVYDTGRDGALEDGQARVIAPRYLYAVRVETGPGAPRGLHFSGNIFHPGSRGVSNVDLAP